MSLKRVKGVEIYGIAVDRGDVLTLISGGVKMTVLAVGGEEMPSCAGVVPAGHLLMAWFDGATLMTAVLPAFCLTW